MKCEDVQKAIWSSLLSADDTAHINTCPACQGDHALMNKIVRDFSSLETPQPSRSLKPSRDEIEKAVRNNKRLPYLRWTSIAASLAALLTAGALITQQLSTPPTESTPASPKQPQLQEEQQPTPEKTPDPTPSQKVEIEVGSLITKDKTNLVTALQDYLATKAEPSVTKKIVINNIQAVIQPGDNRIVAYVNLEISNREGKSSDLFQMGAQTTVVQFLRDQNGQLQVETFSNHYLADQPEQILTYWAQSLHDQNAVLQWATLDYSVREKLRQEYEAANWTLLNTRGKIVQSWKIGEPINLKNDVLEYTVSLAYDKAQKDLENAKVTVIKNGGHWFVKSFSSSNPSPADNQPGSAQREAGLAFEASTAKVGDKIGTMILQELQVTDDGQNFSVYAAFSGKVQVSGRYQYFEDTTEFMGNKVFFYPDKESSKLFPLPERIDRGGLMFEFRNQEEARKHFGQPGSMGSATIEIENYTINYLPKEIWDQVTLLRVFSTQ